MEDKIGFILWGIVSLMALAVFISLFR